MYICTYSYVFLPGMVLTVLCPCLLNFPRCLFACLFVCFGGEKKQLANNAWACLAEESSYKYVTLFAYLRTNMYMYVHVCKCWNYRHATSRTLFGAKELRSPTVHTSGSKFPQTIYVCTYI